ncbi:MAG: hypothetical protein SPL73_06260 [Cyanobacteriota bacterium]|nr:hypothetical protein [Cyanobacteriota bacterium]MDY6364476.1 hypothetical protein [Cyanobacteriota bacterium]
MLTLNTSYPANNYNFYRNKFNADNVYKNNNNSNNAANTPAFTGLFPKDSKFLEPFKRGMGKVTDGIAHYFLEPLMSSKAGKWLDNREDAGHIVDHMQTLGSCVVTGMYMTQTLRNKEMDSDRKKTLAINQGLTLVVSNIIAHVFSRKLENQWDKNISMKYAGWRLGFTKQEVAEKLKQYQIKDAKSYYNRHQDYDALKQYKAQFDEYLKTDTKLAEYIKAHPEEEALKILTTKAKFNKNKGYKNYKLPNLVAYVEKEVNSADINLEKAGKNLGNLGKELKGLNIFKSLLIFTSVFRFIGPVAVTPVASWIADKFIHPSKGEKQTAATDKADNKAADKTTDKEPAAVKNDDKTQQVEDNDIAAFSRPVMAKFLGGQK